MVLLNDATEMFIGDTEVLQIFMGDTRVWPNPVGPQPRILSFGSSGEISLTRGEVEDAELYELRRDGTLIATQEGRVYTDTGLAWNVAYSYTVTPIVFEIPGTESDPSDTVTIPKGSITGINATKRTHTSFTIDWPAVPGADKYRIEVDEVLLAEQVGRSRTIATTNDTTTDIVVTPIRGGTLGNPSATHQYYSGRAQVRDQGSRRFWIRSATTGSWRTSPTSAWGTQGDRLRQGKFESSSPGYYRGVIDFGHEGAYNEALSRCGSVAARIANGWASEAIVHLHKNPGVGHYSGIRLRWNVTNTPAGSDPMLSVHGSWSWVSTQVSGTFKPYGFGLPNANELIRNKRRGIFFAYDSYDRWYYGEFLGKSSGPDHCDVIVTWNWNYVTVTYKSPTWALA